MASESLKLSDTSNGISDDDTVVDIGNVDIFSE